MMPTASAGAIWRASQRGGGRERSSAVSREDADHASRTKWSGDFADFVVLEEIATSHDRPGTGSGTVFGVAVRQTRFGYFQISATGRVAESFSGTMGRSTSSVEVDQRRAGRS